MQQLRVGRHEHQLGIVRSLCRPDHGIARFQADDLEVRTHREAGGDDALDRALSGAEGDRSLAVETHETQNALALGRDAEVVAQRSTGGELHRRRRHGREVDGGEADDATEVGQSPDLGADGGLDGGQDRIVLAATCRDGEFLALAEVDADGTSRGREHEHGGRIGDLQIDRTLGRSGLGRSRVHQECAPRCSVCIGCGVELLGDRGAEQGRAVEQFPQCGDLRQQRIAFGLQLDTRELGQTAQAQLEDVLRLELAQIEDGAQPRAGLLRVVGGADDLDDLVDVEDRDEQTLYQVQTLLAPLQTVSAAAGDDLEPVTDVDAQHLLEAQRARLAIDQGDVVDAERVLQRSQPVELLEHGVRVEAGLDADRDAQSVVAVGEVGDVADALQLLRLHRIPDLLQQALGSHHVRQLGHDDAGTPRAERLDGGLAPHLEGAASVRVRVLDTVESHQDPAGGEVRSGDELHQLLGGRIRILEEVSGRRDHFDEVVRRHVGRHADGDPTRAVDQQVGEGGRQHGRLLELTVVVRDEVDDVLVEVLGEGQRGGGESCLGVSGCSGPIVEGAEVAVPVDQGHTQRPLLREPHERVIDRRVAVGVQLSHDLADDARTLDVAAVRTQAHLGHLIQDAALHGLQPVARIGQGTRVDHRVRVFEERTLHLAGEVDVLDALLDGLGRRSFRHGLPGGIREPVSDWLGCPSCYRPRRPAPGVSSGWRATCSPHSEANPRFCRARTRSCSW